MTKPDDDVHTAYAFIDQSYALPPSSSSDDDVTSSPYSIRLPTSKDGPSIPNDGVSAVSITTMEQWYEYYAMRTPSAGYLIRQEEEQRQHQMEKQTSERRQRGWLGRLFFGKPSEKDDGKSENAETDDESMESEIDSVAPTRQLSLDVRAIHHEAQSFHRFHLVSERRAVTTSNELREDVGQSVVLPVRITVGLDEYSTSKDDKSQTTHFCIVGYGQIAEFPSLPETSFASLEQQQQEDNATDVNSLHSNPNNTAAKIRLTSDHADLLSFATRLDRDDPKPLYDLRHCRAASVGSDCLVISWGLGGDGSVVIYRRLETHKKSRTKRRVEFEEQPTIGWMAVAYSTPSDSVVEAALHNMTPDPCFGEGYQHREQEHNLGRLFELGSLRVTDLVPLVLNRGVDHSPPLVVLAISRLGGFMELLPLPNWMWLDEMTAPPRKLLDLSTTMKITAFSTSIHHIDITAIDAYCTHDECVLVAAGRPFSSGSDDSDNAAGGSALSFWSIAAVFSGKDSGFDLNITFIQRCDISNLGADSAVFITGATIEYWSQLIQNRSSESSKTKKNPKYTAPLMSSITVSAPITSLRFTPSPPVASVVSSGVLLAALDYNGGFTVLDCSRCMLSLKQNDANEALANQTAIMPLTDRNVSMSIESSNLCLSRAFQIEWWNSQSPFEIAGAGQNQEQCLVDTSSFGTFSLAINTTITRMQAKNSSVMNMIRLQRWNMTSYNCDEPIQPTDVFCITANSTTVKENIPATMLLPMRYHSSTETLSLLQLPSSCGQLAVCGIRKFTDPAQVITVLLRQSDPGRALDVARSFGGVQHFGSAIMNKCQIQLWEEQRNIEALKLVSDDEYVVREALCLEQRLSMESEEELNFIHMQDLIDIYYEALQRLDELKSGDRSVSPEWLSNSALKLRKSLRLAGTFELLLQNFAHDGLLNENFQVDSLARRFLCGFQYCDLMDIASSAASRGDINALTIILTRHPESTRTRMKLLQLIPLDVDVSFFEHLLPCSISDNGTDGMFLPKSQIGAPRQFLDSMEMLLFLARSNIPNVIMNETDEEFLLKHYHDGDESCVGVPPSREEVACWYLSFLLIAHDRTRDVVLVKKICERALVRLGFIVFAEDGTYEMTTSDNQSVENNSVDKLLYLYYASDLLSRLVGERIKERLLSCSVHVKHWAAETELFYSIVEFCSMNASNAVEFVLENAKTSSILFEHHVAQFFSRGDCLAPVNNGVVKCNGRSNSMKYEDIRDLCLDRIKQSSNRKRKRKITVNDSDASADIELRLEQALSVCSFFASFRRDEWSVDELIDFAVNVLNCAINIGCGESRVPSHDVIDKLWCMFESLPYSLTKNQHQRKAVDRLKLRLVVIQLHCRWGEHQPMADSVKTIVCSETYLSETSSNYDIMFQACSDLLTTVTRGFCAYSLNQNGHGRDMLLDFILDVDEVDKLYCGSIAEETKCVGAVLLPLLLRQDMFTLLKDLLCIRPTWFSHDYTRAVLLSHIRVPLNNANTLSSQKLLDSLGSVFPELRIEFETQRRLYDAKLFARNEMRVEAELLELLFTSQNSTSPNSLVKSLLSNYPQSLLVGCEFWSDEMSNERALRDASSYFSSQIDAALSEHMFDESSHVLPPMPGALVMQMSNILGSMCSYDVLIVKQSMVNAALELGLAHAAIAICWSMLCDAVFARQNRSMDSNVVWTERLENLVQYCVIVAITRPGVVQVQIVKNICAQSLRLFESNSTLSHTLLKIYSSLEISEIAEKDAGKGSCEEESVVPTDEHPEFLVFIAAQAVAKQAKDFVEQTGESSTTSGCLRSNPSEGNPFYDMSQLFSKISADPNGIDVCALISSLREGSNSNEVALNDLSRAFFSWAVSYVFKLTCHTMQSAAMIRMVVELGASCLAEVTDKKTASRALEMTMERFNANSLTFKSSISDFIQPDPTLAQRLHERGYGWNAARRACIMTKNQGYSEALGWAVAHFQDEDFDSPLFIVNGNDNSSLQGDMIILLVENLLRFIKARHESSIGKVGMKPALTVATNDIKMPPRAPAILSTQQTLAEASVNFPPSTKPTVQNESSVESRTTNNPRLETPTNASSSTAMPPNSADSMSSIEGSLGSRTSVQRQINRGKAVLGTSKISAEERKRLAMEGKRLLEAARRKNKTIVAPPTSIITKSVPKL